MTVLRKTSATFYPSTKINRDTAKALRITNYSLKIFIAFAEVNKVSIKQINSEAIALGQHCQQYPKMLNQQQ